MGRRPSLNNAGKSFVKNLGRAGCLTAQELGEGSNGSYILQAIEQ